MSAVNDANRKTEALFTRVRRRREELGLTVSGLAELLGWSKGYVSMLERGERELHPDLYAEMTEAMNGLERERRERAPAVRAAVNAIMNKPHLVALRRASGLSTAKQGRNDIQDFRMGASGE